MEEVVVHASLALRDGTWGYVRFEALDEHTAQIRFWVEDQPAVEFDLASDTVDSLLSALEHGRAHQKRAAFVRYLRQELADKQSSAPPVNGTRSSDDPTS